MDIVSPKRRSEIMARVRDKNTRPEWIVRRMIYALGYRYRLHVRSLPGTPDLVFKTRKKVIFVHGCFWHRHSGCKLARLPKSNIAFWSRKLSRNAERDERNMDKLINSGWRVLVIWGCELGDKAALRAKIRRFLEGNE